jgi:Ser/Thr protein kinase RdoA (MazF antagonist)
MMHGDLSPSNILLRAGKVTGVVDIDATGRGWGVYDLLTAALSGIARNVEPKGSLCSMSTRLPRTTVPP